MMKRFPSIPPSFIKMPKSAFVTERIGKNSWH